MVLKQTHHTLLQQDHPMLHKDHLMLHKDHPTPLKQDHSMDHSMLLQQDHPSRTIPCCSSRTTLMLL